MAENREVGLGKQRIDELTYRSMGFDVRRRRTGCDFEATRPANPFTGRSEHYFFESKSTSTAPIRPLQKKMQRKKGKKYRVLRGFDYL